MDTQADLEIARLIVDQSPDAIVFAGTDGVIQAWNEAATAMFGFAATDAIGKDLNLIIPEQFRDQHWTGYDRALAAGDTKYRGQSLPTKALKASGDSFYVELGFAIVHDDAGAVIGALAHARDITQRFERDRTSRRELRELQEELKALRGEAAT